jgi:hypothetical protein
MVAAVPGARGICSGTNGSRAVRAPAAVATETGTYPWTSLFTAGPHTFTPTLSLPPPLSVTTQRRVRALRHRAAPRDPRRHGLRAHASVPRRPPEPYYRGKRGLGRGVLRVVERPPALAARRRRRRGDDDPSLPLPQQQQRRGGGGQGRDAATGVAFPAVAPRGQQRRPHAGDLGGFPPRPVDGRHRRRRRDGARRRGDRVPRAARYAPRCCVCLLRVLCAYSRDAACCFLPLPVALLCTHVQRG